MTTRKPFIDPIEAPDLSTKILAKDAADAAGYLTVEDVLSVPYHLFYAKDYGVVGDGATDDTTSLNLALAAAAAAGGGTVILPGGTLCGVTAKLTISADVTLTALAGGGLKALSNVNDYMILGSAAHGAAIIGLTIDAGSYDGGANSSAIAFVASDNIQIVGNVISGMGRFGIVVNGSDRFKISDNKVTLVTAVNTQNEGILIANSLAATKGQIVGNVLVNTGMEVSAAYTKIDSNVISSWKFGGGIGIAQSANCHDLTITNNVTSGGIGMDVNGFVVDGIEMWAPNCVVTGNIAFNNASNGFDFGGLNSLYALNIAYDNSQYNANDYSGIAARYGTAEYNCSGSRFIGNQSYNTAGVAGPQKYGYEEQSASISGVTLSGNNFATNQTADTLLLSATTKDLDGAWRAWTPTVTASSGTLTTVSADGRYTRVGRTFMFSMNIVITTNGGASGALSATLPAGITAAAYFWGCGGFSFSTGFGCQGRVLSGATSVTSISTYDGSYPGGDGASLMISGSFETTT